LSKKVVAPLALALAFTYQVGAGLVDDGFFLAQAGI
jgi:hypothetical protein